MGVERRSACSALAPPLEVSGPRHLLASLLRLLLRLVYRRVHSLPRLLRLLLRRLRAVLLTASPLSLLLRIPQRQIGRLCYAESRAPVDIALLAEYGVESPASEAPDATAVQDVVVMTRALEVDVRRASICM